MTPSEPVGPDAGPQADPVPATSPAPNDRRLHPWSWLFVLLQQLRQFIVPLIAAFFVGGDRNELWPLIGVAVLTLSSVMQYLTYRYAIGRDAITIRSGWLHRQRREIPFARIHNVSVDQTMLHRLFGVAEVRLESAGGQKPEAQMRVLRMDDALALERLVRHRGAVEATVEGVAEPAPDVLLEMPLGEVLRLGIISNRGVLVLATAYAASMQFSPRLVGGLFEHWSRVVFGWTSEHHFGPMQYGLAAVTLALAVLALMRLLSIVLAVLQYAGFRLTEDQQRLTVERGLLGRARSSVSRRRLQAWTLHEGLLHRLLKRRSLHVDTAASVSQGNGQQRRALRELAPIATPDACDALIEHLLPPDANWSGLDWLPMHPSSALRIFLGGAWFPLVVTAALCWQFGAYGLLALLWLPWSAYLAHHHAKCARYAINDRIVAVRGGWWSRHWRFAELDKLQALRLSCGPLDRRWGMATLWLDTAGATPGGTPLRIPHLPEAEARELLDRLARILAARKLRW
jgi:putative membrane protein